MSEKILGADAAAGVNDTSVASDQLSHAEPKFTPGPWLISSSFLVVTPQAEIVARCEPFQVEGLNLPFTQCIANAHLIAAAPELYEALRFHAEQVYAILSSDGYADIPSRIIAAQEHVTAWRAALAKAEGR